VVLARGQGSWCAECFTVIAMCVGGRLSYVVDKDLGENLRRSSVDCGAMWTPHLPLLSPGISKEIRLQKLAVAKKMLNAFQHGSSPGFPMGQRKSQR
jgi:hypothetical protein